LGASLGTGTARAQSGLVVHGGVTPNAPALVDVREADTAMAQVRPNPPTDVRVDFAPTAEVVDKIFQKYGIAKETRVLIGDALKRLDDSDLTYLAKGLDPATIGFAAPASVSAEDWARVVPAYAEAMLVDRKRRSDFLYQSAIGSVLAVLGIPLAVWGGMWLERRKNRPTPAPVVQRLPASPQGNSKRRRR
jgi:hypothetical protein